jgi:hypothetical protein
MRELRHLSVPMTLRQSPLCFVVAALCYVTTELGAGEHLPSVGARNHAKEKPSSYPVFLTKREPIDWFASETSVTGHYFNKNAGIRWRNPSGDWIDARGILQGNQPFAVARATGTDSVATLNWNVTTLVKNWQAHPQQVSAILLRAAGGAVRFRSNQSPNSEPKLVVSLEDGQVREVLVQHDTSVDISTAYTQGQGPEGGVGYHASYLLQWERAKLFPDQRQVTSAALRMVSTARFGAPEVAAYQLAIPVKTVLPPVEVGLAAHYVADVGLHEHPDVVLVENFRGTLAEVESRWHGAGFTAIDACDLPGVAQCARASVMGTDDGGNGLRGVAGRRILPRELDEVYMRYYVKFGSWPSTVVGGKLPGLANYDSGDGQRYFAGGNGGSPVHGYDGWTLRGSFGTPMGSSDPAPGYIPLGTYAYHGAMNSAYGDGWNWTPDGTDLHLLKPGSWYAIEQHVKVNTPGKADGIFEVWIDGHKVLRRADVVLRADPNKTPRSYPNGKPVPADQWYWVPGNMGIYKLWANLYHGGTTPTKGTLVAHWANFVVATRYIGPMGYTP